jgi:carboxymethylenebutenolidase
MQQRVESVETPDGSFDLPVWVPAAGSGPGLLLIQEIFGISDYIQAVAGDLAGLGYVVAAPELFWRVKRGHSPHHDEQGLQEAFSVASRFDAELGVADTVRALHHLTTLAEVTGGTGIVGFCLGGSIAYLAAAQTKPDVVVSFYGTMVPGRLDLLDAVTSPLQFHFSGQDPYIPRDQVKQVEDAVAGRANVEIHVEEEAGHAFHNRMAPMFYHPEAADRAWQHTVDFLQRHLPARRAA